MSYFTRNMLSDFTNYIQGQEWIFLLVIVGILVVVGIIAIVKSIAKRVPIGDKKRLNLLKNRLAKGEITKEEYDELKKEFT